MDDIRSALALRSRQASKALNISDRLLWQLTHDGHIPCVRVGNGKRQTVLYPVADLQAWLTRQAASGEGGQS
jgi:excisionase family DNA binding protein